LDDALTLTYLFAALPAHTNLAASTIATAQRLAAAWSAYCTHTSVLEYCFCSVKGIYMQATMHGVCIRWLQPHAYTQYVPDAVDLRVLRTFGEFYETLLNFILYRLYQEQGSSFPLTATTARGLPALVQAHKQHLQASRQPKESIVQAMDVEQDENEEEKVELPKTKTTSKESKRIAAKVDEALENVAQDEDDHEEEDDDDGDEDNDDTNLQGPLAEALHAVTETDDAVAPEAHERRQLFRGMVFFLSREVPRGYLDCVAQAFGAELAANDDDVRITHYIVDRPQSTYHKQGESVQPQWILDCVNFRVLLPLRRYRTGVELPPHLSPWADDSEYKPAYAEEIQRIQQGLPVEEQEVVEQTNTIDNDEAIDEPPTEPTNAVVEEEEDDDDVARKQQESRKRKAAADDAAEAHALAHSMMSRKAQHLYGRMQYGLAKKQAAVDELHRKRADLECPKGKDAQGQTVVKQKVERLKKERSSIEKEYKDTGGSMKKKRNKKRKN